MIRAASLNLQGLSVVTQLLLAVRAQRKLNQAQLGELLGVSRWTVNRWECGDQEPPVYLQSALRELLGQ